MDLVTIAWRILVGLVVAYVLFGTLLACTQRRIIFQPATDAPDRDMAGLTNMAEVSVMTDDGLALLAWHRPPAVEGAPTLLYLHGNAGHIGHRGGKVRSYLEAGYGLMLLSWRGYGGNPGQPSEDGFYADARAAHGFLAAQGVGAGQLIIYGESIGSGPAVHLAHEQDIAALILEAPFTSMPNVAQDQYWWLPARWLVRDKFASIEKIDDIDAPLLIIHGARDRVIPVAHGRALMAAAREPKQAVIFADGRHNDLYEHGAAREVHAFIEATAGGK